MKNARPRFALLEDGRLHDYGTDRTIDATGTIDTPDGKWDLMKVRQLIEDEGTIETAFTPHELAEKEAELNRTKKKLKWAQSQIPPAPADPAPPAATDKVDQANADFAKNTPAVDPNDKVEKSNVDFQGEAGNSGSNGQ